MVDFTAWVYAHSTDAQAVLHAVGEVVTPDLELADAAAASWTIADARPRWVQLTKPSPSWSAPGLQPTFWEMTFGLIFYVPLLGAATGEVSDDPLLERVPDVDRHLVNSLRDELTPGTSVLMLVGSTRWVDEASGVADQRDGARQLFRLSFAPRFEAATLGLLQLRHF